jgi:L-ascorbate metabolism protein UlaG (beta-lactamase superfamily)
MEQACCYHPGVSRRDFLGLACGCSLVAATFGEAFANTDPVRVAQASGLAGTGRARATYLGHSVFRIDTPGGKVIYIDPWLSNPKAPKGAKDVDKADLILLSHGHADHLGETVEVAKKTNARLLIIADLTGYFQNQGVPAGNLIRMNKGGTAAPLPGSPIKVTVVHADHSSTVAYTDPNTKMTSVTPGGEAVGYIIQLENGLRILHAGDTALYGDMELLGKRYKPDVAMLPIGDCFTMGPEDAAEAARMWGAKTVIPMHYGTFPLLTGTVEAFKASLGTQAASLKAPAPGDTVEF